MRKLGLALLLGVIISCQMATPAHAATRYETGLATSATLLRMKDEDLKKRLRDIKSLGATWLRIDFSWHAIQPDGPTKYDWQMYDRVVRAAGEHNLKILAVLDYTPQWSREPRCAERTTNENDARKCNPRGSEEFGRFAAAVSFHFKGTAVRAWEIWNEPNLIAYWKTVQPDGTLFVDPVAYAAMANAAAKQIRYHYPDSVIITGGLSPLFEPKRSKGMRQSEFLARTLPHLDAAFFDGIGIHPYTWPILPGKEAVYNAFYTVDHGKSNYNLRTIMAKAGWGNKEIWGTEFGASTRGERPMTALLRGQRPDHVTENKQAQIITEGVDLWYKKENVGPLFVHSDSDEWLLDHRNEGGFGLRREDGSKKPAYEAYGQAARKIE